MALFKQIFAEDASSPGRVARNGVLSLFAPGTRTLITIKTVTGEPLANPVTVNEFGFGVPFDAPGYTQVAWEAVTPGQVFTGTFESYEGVLEQATLANGEAQRIAAEVPQRVTESVTAALGGIDPSKLANSYPLSTGIQYDTNGNVAGVTVDGVTTTYTYNPDGSVATDKRANVSRAYSYAPNGDLTAIVFLPPPPTVTETFQAADGPLSGTQTTAGSLTWAAEGGTVIGRSAGLLKPLSGTGIGFALVNPNAVARVEAYCQFLHPTRASRRSALVFRYQDANNYWGVTPRANGTIQTWALIKVVAGVTTVIASIPGEAAISTHRVEVTTNTVKWFIDGALFASADDSALSAAKRVGFRGEFNTDPSTRWDDFKVWEAI